MGEEETAGAVEQITPAPVPWLADAPLFLDGFQVTAFYDAIIRPAGNLTTTLRITNAEGFKRALGLQASLKAGISKWLPFLHFEAGAEAGVESTKEVERASDTEIVLRGIDTPYRQLLHLGLYYATTSPDRLLYVNPAADNVRWLRATDPELKTTLEWQSARYIGESPRPLIFLDLPPFTKLIPMAAESTEGRVVTFYERIIDKMAKRGGNLPIKYPESEAGKPENKLRQERKEYWAWFAENFNPQRAMEIVEDTVGEVRGRLRWIDYRAPLSNDGTTMHLHLCGREEYDTGVFAYNFIKRGYKHGLRIVGTLKQEPDVNVLAVFEK